MLYNVRRYKKEDYESVISLIIKQYKELYPVYCYSRIIFCNHINLNFNNVSYCFENSCYLFFENNTLVACLFNEGSYDGSSFFVFDSIERSKDLELVDMMITLSKTYGSNVCDDNQTRYSNVYVDDSLTHIVDRLHERGYVDESYSDRCLILPFNRCFDVKLPKGYYFKNVEEINSFDLAIIHRLSFNYKYTNGFTDYNSVKAFNDLINDDKCDKDLIVVVYDELDQPVGFAIGWVKDGMKYAEMEPLAVTWWNRRKGIATSIIHELANRIMKKNTNLIGLRGGDQEFYYRIGFVEKAKATTRVWKDKVIISWEKESINKDYSKNI